MLVRIMPVAYSLVTGSTPRTPTAIWASWTPARPMAVGSKLAHLGGRARGLVTLTRDYSTPKPTMRATVASSDRAVDGWIRNLVHSEGQLVRQVGGDGHRPALGGQVPQQGPQQVTDPADPLGVQAVDRLVEDDRGGVAEQGGGDAQALAQAEREATGPPAHHLA
jgi:hypothetical protein